MMESDTSGIGDELKVSVIVCTRNRCELLGDCMDSLLDQELADDRYEVIVVDDGSTDDTEGIAISRGSREEGPRVMYVGRSHAGVNASRNAGLRAARGEIVVFVDDDEIAPPAYLDRVVEYMAAHPELDGVGGPLRGRGDDRLPTCPDCTLGDRDLPGDGVRRVDRLIGGNMAIRAAALTRVGEFDETISGRGDENEWFMRATGLRFVADPDLWVWHRRETFGWWELIRHSFVQGMALPVAYRRMGQRRTIQFKAIVVGIAHAVRRRCARGIMHAVRELGVIVSKFAEMVGRSRSGVGWRSEKTRGG